MVADGCSAKAIRQGPPRARRMGHADAKTTEIYSHYAPDPSGGTAFAERAFGSDVDSRETVLTRDITL